MEVYLIRHGEIDRVGGRADYFYRLTEEGRENAYNASKFIKNFCFNPNAKSILLTSCSLRTIETSLYISEAIQREITPVDGCYELDMGYNECKEKKDWLYIDTDGKFTNRSGMSVKEKFRVRHYLGESPHDVYERVKGLEEVIRNYDGDSIYVVGHGTSLRLLTMRLMGYDEKWYYDEPIPKNCSIKKLVLTDDKKVDLGYLR